MQIASCDTKRLQEHQRQAQAATAGTSASTNKTTKLGSALVGRSQVVATTPIAASSVAHTRESGDSGRGGGSGGRGGGRDMSPRPERRRRAGLVLRGRLHPHAGADLVGARAGGAAPPRHAPRPAALAVRGSPPEGQRVRCSRQVGEGRLLGFRDGGAWRGGGGKAEGGSV